MKKKTATAPAAIDLRNLQFRRLDAKGKELPDDVTKGHAITHFPQIGLMFDVRKPKTVQSRAAAHAIAKKSTLLGRKGDWVVGETIETQILIDRAFQEPAVNPKVAPNMPASGWIYTATPVKCSADHAWFVNLYSGVVSWSSVDSEGLVVPVLRVPASQ